MFRFNSAGALLSAFALLCICVIALCGSAMIEGIAGTMQSNMFHRVIIASLTCYLGGLTAGVRRRMPNYGGRPPMSDLKNYLKPTILLSTMATFLCMRSLQLLSAVNDSLSGSAWTLKASFAVNVGIIVINALIAFGLMRQYREACAWEDAIHPPRKAD